MLGKKILVIDEKGFSRVCSAILEHEGYRTDVSNGEDIIVTEGLSAEDYGLVVTSYPYGYQRLSSIREWGIPIILLSDQINRDVIGMLECNEQSYCMIKPLDYQKFKSLVRQIMTEQHAAFRVPQGGYNIA